MSLPVIGTARRRVLVTLILLGFWGLWGRTFWLQGGGPKRWSNRAMEQHLYDLTQPPRRGGIFDREGRDLVNHKPQFLLYSSSADELDTSTLLSLARVLSSAEVSRLQNGRPVPIPKDKLATLTELVSGSDHLYLEEVSSRGYPQELVACHLLGYVKQEVVSGATSNSAVATSGVEGLERSFDRFLQGVPGKRSILVSAGGKELGMVSALQAKNGHDLVTTIDLELQIVAEKALRAADQRLSSTPGRRVAAPRVAAMMSIPSGEMLVMASSPGYNPELFLNGDPRVSELLSDTRAPLMNRVIAGQYPAASTFKLITAAAVLRTHPEWTTGRFFCSGSKRYGSTTFHCFVREGHGSLTFSEAVAHSCDTVFYDLAVRLGPDRLLSTAKELGIGQTTGIALPGEAEGLLPSPEFVKRMESRPWANGDSANTGIGQGFVLVTPIQLLTAVARLLTKEQVQPVLSKSVNAITEPKPVDPELGTLWNGCLGAVNNGTAKSAYLSELSVAGKTGTAEAPVTKDNPEGHNHTWFVAWAPADKPQVVALAMFEGSGGYGGEVAAPVVKSMLKAWFRKSVRKN